MAKYLGPGIAGFIGANLAHEAIGYRLTVEFKEGLRQTVEWYKTEFASVSATT